MRLGSLERIPEAVFESVRASVRSSRVVTAHSVMCLLFNHLFVIECRLVRIRTVTCWLLGLATD